MKFDYEEENVKSIGEFLQRVREDQELTLEDVAKGTRINKRFLEALEEDREEELPDINYRDLFIKSYAEFLGIEAEVVMLRLPDRKRKGKQKKSTEKAATEGTTKAVGKPMPELSAARKPRTRIWLIVLLGVVATAAILYTLWDKGDGDEPLTIESRPPDTIQQPVAEVTPPDDSLFLLLVGQERCWLDVRIDGDSVYTRFIDDTDTVRFAIADSVVLKLGKANGVQGWLNGLPLTLAAADDSATALFQLDKLNYPRYVDSSKLVE